MDREEAHEASTLQIENYRTADQRATAGSRIGGLSQEKAHQLLVQCQTHTNNVIESKKVIFSYIFEYTYMYTTISESRGHIFEAEWGGVYRRGGRKEKNKKLKSKRYHQ